VPVRLEDLLAPSPDAQRRPAVAVLTMELQRGVMGDLASFPDLARAAADKGVVEHTARLLQAARRVGVPVVHCTAEFREDRAGTVVNSPLHSATLRRPDHMVSGTPATEVVPELEAAPSDLWSWRTHGVSPFTGTSLDTLLRNLGVRVVVATGVSVNVAITGLCIEAVGLGYQVVLPRDAVAGVPAAYADAVIDNSLALLGLVTTVDEVIAALPGGP
jgi:nicotinamidase-related amidase